MIKKLLSFFRRKKLREVAVHKPVMHKSKKVHFESESFLQPNKKIEQCKHEMSNLLKNQPTDEQWAMILTLSKRVNVIAGAGSGKSTTLALRVVFLYKYLDVPLNEITIISFTTKSCQEMRDKLVKTFNECEIDENEKSIHDIVKTFHSLAFRQYGSLFGEYKLFESFNKAPANQPLSSSLSQTQFIELKDIFGQLMENDLDFQNDVRILSKPLVFFEKNKNYLPFFMEKEKEYSTDISMVWKKKGLGIYIKLELIPIKLTHYLTIHAHGRLEDGRLIILRSSQYNRTQEEIWTYQSFIEEPFLVLDDLEKDFDFLKNEMKYPKLAKYSADLFQVKNQIGAYVNVLDYVYGEICFAENFALQHDDINLNDSSIKNHEIRAKLNLIYKIWCETDKYLEACGKVTSNKIFAKLAKALNSNEGSSENLQNLKHLMIDEFQDISPLLANWIKGCKRVLDKEHVGSFMCVGDDWQSIYGWRGSAPSFITNFDKYFGSSTSLKMTNNFRSSQLIINGAEKLIEGVNDKTDNRKGIAANIKYKHANHDIELHPFDESTVRKIMSKLLENTAHNKIYLISRTSSDRAKFKKILDDPKIKFAEEITIHSSKGLESEVVIILGDCTYSGVDFIRNNFISKTDLRPNNDPFRGYDKMQKDEALRLMYVAITRAQKQCIWFCSPNDKSPGAYAQFTRKYN